MNPTSILNIEPKLENIFLKLGRWFSQVGTPTSWQENDITFVSLHVLNLEPYPSVDSFLWVVICFQPIKSLDLKVSLVLDPKINVPNSVTYLNRTPIFYCYVVECGSQNMIQKDTNLEENWSTCSTYDNYIYSKLNSQHDYRNLYNHLWAWKSSLWKLRGKCLRPWFGFANHLVLIGCFIS